ncbi:MAG: hypothetical protein KatS3mg109_0098 [Pirellulaceae bacterium]|nr:MAG: hypothetical protein KatS3mg109_0098 [Pirellulaceae bacterium]
MYGSTRRKYLSNLRASRRDSFVQRMVREIKDRRADRVRIHASGDFYSPEYVRKWVEIARECRQTEFYAYTRSWQDGRGNVVDDREDLLCLARQPNVRLWLSADKDTGKPPRWRSCRVAYMQSDDADIPGFKPDLVFRVKRKTVSKRVGRYQSLVCPVEQGLPSSKRITCEKCQLCFSQDRMIWGLSAKA